MRRGGRLRGAQAVYEAWGELSEARDNAVLLFTGLSPSAHAASSSADPRPGWWEAMIGPGRPLDTDRLFVFCVNSLGSCFGSTGPASINPATRRPYRLDFPALSIEDIADAAHEVTRSLGIERLRAVVGASLGGMSALAYVLRYPQAARNLVAISSALRAASFAIAVRSLQREAIRSDPAWQGGYYDAGSGPVAGMRLARKLGVTTYRSAREWETRFGRQKIAEPHADDDPFAPEFQVESYLEHHAQRFVGTFDPNSYLYLSRAMDWFDAAEDAGSLPAALTGVALSRALVVGVETDILFPLEQQQELASDLEQAGVDTEFFALPSVQGHDSFLVDHDRFAPLVGRFLGDI